MSDSVTPWITARQVSLSITNSWSLLKLMSIESVMPSSHLILCCPLLLLPPIPPSTRVFSNESTLHMRWSKYWSFSFSISPSNEHPGLISFRMDIVPMNRRKTKSNLNHYLLSTYWTYIFNASRCIRNWISKDKYNHNIAAEWRGLFKLHIFLSTVEVLTYFLISLVYILLIMTIRYKLTLERAIF